MIDGFNQLLEKIARGQLNNYNELTPFLALENKDERCFVNIKLAEVFIKFDSFESLQIAADLISRAWLLSGYSHDVLELYVKIHKSLGDLNAIKEAFKRTGLNFAEHGNPSEAIKYFNKWHYVYADYEQKDLYVYDPDILSAIERMAKPYIFTHEETEYTGKIRIAYLVKGMFEVNSVLVKINKLFAQHHDKTKFEVAFFIPEAESNLNNSKPAQEVVEALKSYNCEVFIAPDSGNKFEQLLALGQKIYDFKPRILITSAALSLFEHYFIASLKPAKLLVGLNQGPVSQFVWHNFDHAISWFNTNLVDCPVNSTYIPLEYELNNVHAENPVSRAELGIPEDAHVLLSGGRINKLQDHAFWGTIVKFLKDDQSLHYIILGAAAEDVPYSQFVTDPELNQRIHFFKWNKDYLNYLPLADAVIDTFPIGGGVFMMEAMLLGIPVISFRHSYIRIIDGTVGSASDEVLKIPELLVNRDDYNAFESTVARLLAEPDKLKQLGQLCRQQILTERSNPERMVKRMENVYLNLLGEGLLEDDIHNSSENSIVLPVEQGSTVVINSENEKPFITVIVPTYNQAEYLGEALDSLLAQTYKNWEAVIVNDGSTDDTKIVMEAYAEKDPRFKLFHKANGGVATALNVGIKEARGEWICWLSSDDMFEPDKLEIHYNAIIENPEIKFFHSHWYLYFQETKQKIAPGLWLPIPQKEFQVSRFFIANYVHGNAIAIHKSVFGEVGLFNESMRQGQDFDMWLRISAKFESHFIDKRTCVTRIHKSQTTNTFAEGGVLDSTRSLIRFLNGNDFEALFPFSDFNNPKTYPLLVNEIVYISARKNSFIYRCGYTTALVERALEWITNKVPEKYKKVLFDMLQHLVHDASAGRADKEIMDVLNIFLDRKKIKYIKHNFIEDTIKYIKQLAGSGDQRTSKAIEKYLLNIINSNSEPESNIKDYTPLLLNYPKDDIYKQLNPENILQWYISPGGMADNLVKHEMEIHCPVCENNFKIVYDYEMLLVPSSNRFICPECKTGYEYTDKNLDEDFVVFNRNKVKVVQNQTQDLRIAFLIHDATYIGGGTKVVFKHIDWLLKLGCKVTVYSFVPKPAWVKAKADFVVIKADNEIEQDAADLFVVFSIFDLPSLLNKVPIEKIVHLCQGYEGYHFGRNYEELRSDKYILTMLHSIPVKNISVSSHLTDLFMQKFSRVSQYIPNSINHKVFSFAEYKTREEKSVLFIGNPMHPLKGFQFLATALKLIRNSDTMIKNLKINIVVGTKFENEKQIKELISHETGCLVAIRSKLESKEVAALIKESCVVVCSSWYEGFSLPLLEAMASGVPVITTNNMGAESFCINGKNSFIVRFGDLKSLATNLMHIFYPDAGLKLILQNAFQTSLEYTELNSAKHLINSYQNLLGSSFNETRIEELLNEIAPQHLLSETGTSSHKNISVIIPVYNNVEYTKMCVESLFKYTPCLAELIVIDNASTDTTREYLFNLQSSDSRVTIISNENNIGFPGAVNQGLSKFTSAYAVIANNDIVFTSGWAEGLINLAESDNKIGIAGPMSNSVSGVQLDKNVQYKSIEDMHKYAGTLKKNKKNKWFQFPRVAFLCTLIKKEVIEKLGGLDERYSPGNFEDDDFCLRAQLAGYKTVIAEDVFIHHFGSKSFTANGIDKYKERLEINRQIFINKWGGDPEEIWLKGKVVNSRNLVYSINNDDFTRFFERAQIQVQEKDYLLALSSLEGAVSGYNEEKTHSSIIEYSALLNLTGNVAILADELDIAKKYFEIALNADPQSSFACSGLAEVFYKQEQYESAKIMYEWGVRNNSDNIVAVDGLKRVNHLLGITDNDSVVCSSPENEKDVVKLLETAYSLFEEKKFDEVLETLIIAEKLLPENDMKIRSALESLRGFSYLGLNNYLSARHYFERALYDEPDSSDACAGLAEVFFLTGFEKEAKTMFEWAVAYNPGNKFAKAGLSKVNSVLGYEEYHNSLVQEYN